MKLYEDEVHHVYGLKGEDELVKSNAAAMLAQLYRAYHEKEPIAVALRRRTGRTTDTYGWLTWPP